MTFIRKEGKKGVRGRNKMMSAEFEEERGGLWEGEGRVREGN